MGTPLWMPLSLQLSWWQSAWQGGSRSLKGRREPGHQDPARCALAACFLGQVGKNLLQLCACSQHVLKYQYTARDVTRDWTLTCNSGKKRLCKALTHHRVLSETPYGKKV